MNNCDTVSSYVLESRPEKTSSVSVKFMDSSKLPFHFRKIEIKSSQNAKLNMIVSCFVDVEHLCFELCLSIVFRFIKCLLSQFFSSRR